MNKPRSQKHLSSILQEQNSELLPWGGLFAHIYTTRAVAMPLLLMFIWNSRYAAEETMLLLGFLMNLL